MGAAIFVAPSLSALQCHSPRYGAEGTRASARALTSASAPWVTPNPWADTLNPWVEEAGGSRQPGKASRLRNA
jgi:hypothetical protein